MKTLTTCWPASSSYLRQVTMPTYHMPGKSKQLTLLCLSGKISFSFDCQLVPTQILFHLALNSWLLLSKAMGFLQDALKTWAEFSLPAWSVAFSCSPDTHVIAIILPIPPHLLFPRPCLKMVEEDEIESPLFIIMTPPSHLLCLILQSYLGTSGLLWMTEKAGPRDAMLCSMSLSRSSWRYSTIWMRMATSIHCLSVLPSQYLCLQFSSVAQSCLTLCDPMNRSMPGLPLYHQLPESTQTQVHWVGDAIQPSHPLSSPSPPALNLSQHQGLFKWGSSLHQVAKVLEFQLQHQSQQVRLPHLCHGIMVTFFTQLQFLRHLTTTQALSSIPEHSSSTKPSLTTYSCTHIETSMSSYHSHHLKSMHILNYSCLKCK